MPRPISRCSRDRSSANDGTLRAACTDKKHSSSSSNSIDREAGITNLVLLYNGCDDDYWRRRAHVDGSALLSLPPAGRAAKVLISSSSSSEEDEEVEYT